MTHIKRPVGYVQIALGIMLIFACLVGYDVLMSGISKSYDLTDAKLNMIFQGLDMAPTYQQVVTGLQIRAYSDLTTRFITQTFMITIFILAVIMILQGVANTQVGGVDDIAPKELGKFVTAIFLIIYVLAAGYILLFKSTPNNRILNLLYLLIILAAFLGIICLFKHFIKRNETKKDKSRKPSSK
jgi:uncharacterized membrane protein